MQTFAKPTGPEQKAVAAITPRFDAEAVERFVAAHFYLVSGRFPIPKKRPSCPVCATRIIQLSRISYGVHTRPNLDTAYRADVGFKCTNCSAFWTHGVPITHEVYRAGIASNPDRVPVWNYREILAELERVLEAPDEPEAEPVAAGGDEGG